MIIAIVDYPICVLRVKVSPFDPKRRRSMVQCCPSTAGLLYLGADRIAHRALGRRVDSYVVTYSMHDKLQ